MYYAHFGLSEAPFRITPNTEVFFAGGNRGAILDALIYAIAQGEGIVKVTGEVGTGKTMLCNMLQSRLPAHIETVYLAHPSVSPEEILHAIAFELQLKVARDANRMEVMQALYSYLLQRHAQGKQVVIFVEESQNMPIATLEEVRLLSNLETGKHKLLQIVLFGQPELDDNLRQPHIRQLRERITHSFALPPLSVQEVGEYLMFRMRAVGYRGPDLFSAPVIKRIAQASAGLTRRINLIADKALLAAFSENTHSVQPKHVAAAIRDSEFARDTATRSDSRRRWLIAAATVVVAIAAALYWAMRQTLAPSPVSQNRPGIPAMAASDEARSPGATSAAATPSDHNATAATVVAPRSESKDSPHPRPLSRRERGEDHSQRPSREERGGDLSQRISREERGGDLSQRPSREERGGDLSQRPSREERGGDLSQRLSREERGGDHPQRLAGEERGVDPARARRHTGLHSPVEARSEPTAPPSPTGGKNLSTGLHSPTEGKNLATGLHSPTEGKNLATGLHLPIEGKSEPAGLPSPSGRGVGGEGKASGPKEKTISAESASTDPRAVAAVLDTSVATTQQSPALGAAIAPSAAAPDSRETKPNQPDMLLERIEATRVWLEREAPQTHSIQLLGAENSQQLKDHLRSIAKSIEISKIYVYRTVAGQKPFLTVLYGSFGSREAAQNALDRLPPPLKAFKPYLRTVQGIRDEMSRNKTL